MRIARLVATAAREELFPVVLGGDHSVALGTLAGLAEVHGQGGTIWIDAHGDLNSPDSSPSGNVHGMVLAAALGLAGDRFRQDGWGLPAIGPGRVALVGVRSTARLFAERTRPFLALCYACTVAALALAGWLAGLSGWFYPALLLPSLLLARQIAVLDVDDPASCLRQFRANREAGLAVALALLIGQM